MLYDLLPPLIFFLSLGAMTIIVSRVVLRQRRHQMAADIQAHVTEVGQKKLDKQDIAGVLRPNHKSVHVFRDRVTLLKNQLQASNQSIKAAVLDWRNRRAERKVTHAQKKRVTPPKAGIRDKLNSLKNLRPTRQSTPETSPQDFSTAPQVTPSPKAATLQPVLRITTQESPNTEIKTTARRRRRHLLKKDPVPTLKHVEQAIATSESDKAEAILMDHIVKYPKDAKAYMLLGQVAASKEEWEEAVEAFEYVTNIKPSTKDCFAQLGHATYKVGKFTRAIEALQRAHDADPTNRQVIEDLLTVAQRMNIIPLQKSLTAKLSTLEKL